MPVLVNAKHEIFANLVARGKSQLEAYTLAGYIEDPGNACTLANRNDVAVRIREITEIAAARAQISADRVLAELARLGFSDVTQAVSIKRGKVVVKDTDELSHDMRASIAEISETKEGIKVKMHDKRAALESLGKHLGLWKDNVAIDVNVSLADLVNGSYELEHGEVKPVSAPDGPAGPLIEHDASPPDDSEPAA